MKSAFQNMIVLLTLAGSALAISNPIYVISNAEVPSLFRPGLSPVGLQRATQCLPQLFSTLNIGKIITCPQSEDSCFETLATTQPIADALGLPIDTSCGADENTSDNCVSDLTKKFAKNSTQSILIVWPSLFRPGLSPIGEQRVAQCLPQLFSTLDIGKIISCPRNDESQVCFETLATAQPIADALGLPIDTTCGADENTSDDCISGLTTKFAKSSTQAILIVWEFSEVHTLLEESLDLDTDPADAIDGIHYDVFTTVIKGKITQVTSQNCTDIDGIAPGTDKSKRRRSVAGAGEKRRRRERKSRSRQL
ncbi:hypothetical protein CVT25_004872 [Psilocybe cyanescens]|uniref:Uncharacterized protein n=1 Tax=Psilocybe cyanescens TaxID=93625 RepID=A0A409XMI1_PSICY|nr:hypothetical protein CVT25_004872 [Psilocybe cyanescens]